MKAIRSCCERNKKNSHSTFSQDKKSLVTAPLCEQEIMRIHEAFLTPGVHYFQLPNREAGQRFIEQFLASLHCYNNVGYLAATRCLQEEGMRDILAEIQEEGFLYQPYFLDEFFIHFFDYDFIWVETTSALCSMPWYAEFKNKLQEYKIFGAIPVIMLSYSKQ
jgi:hypothetical protein